MIWVVGNVDGNSYKEPFSKGVLARSLRISNLGLDQAYQIANEIEENLIEENITEITVDDLVNYISKYLNRIDEDISTKYLKWRDVRKSDEPLIILIGGAAIIESYGFREVMRKIISEELNPVIHKSSFDAYESVRTPAIRVDAVVEGFISHVDVVNVGIEAIIERSLKEGISIIIEGVHVVPGFIREDLIKKGNVIMFTLTIDDEEMHRQRFYTRCRQPWVKRSLEHYMDNFKPIRKTQEFLINQAEIHDAHIINNSDFKNTIDLMVNDIIEQFGGDNDDN